LPQRAAGIVNRPAPGRSRAGQRPKRENEQQGPAGGSLATAAQIPLEPEALSEWQSDLHISARIERGVLFLTTRLNALLARQHLS